jgi:hypothetical protein
MAHHLKLCVFWLLVDLRVLVVRWNKGLVHAKGVSNLDIIPGWNLNHRNSLSVGAYNLASFTLISVRHQH